MPAVYHNRPGRARWPVLPPPPRPCDRSPAAMTIRSRRSFSSALALGACIVLLSACPSGPRARVMSAVERRDEVEALAAYERLREADGPDGQVLGEVAALVLEKAALGDDAIVRDAAIQQLVMAGTKGEAVIERLARSRERPVARAKALEILARRGDGTARAELYALLDSDDADVKAAAITATDAEDETPKLIELLGHPAAEVRSAAAEKLGGAARSVDARHALAEAARVDPVPRVRSSAVRALGSFGPDAVEPLRGRLGDPEQSVRLAAVRALVQADREAALLAIGPLLEMPTSSAGIEAARVLALTGTSRAPEGGALPPGVVDGRAYLRRALESGAPADRSQAGIALLSLPPDPSLDSALVAALRSENDAGVKLALASALLRRPGGEEAARTALRELIEGSGMPAVQAAAQLASESDGAAIAKLRSLLREREPSIRRVAARALARDAMQPDAVRAALRDDDALVRVHAAGGILAAAAHD